MAYAKAKQLMLIFAIILLLGMKISPKKEFNENFLSLKISKGIQGFCAICIIAYHFVQPYVLSVEGIEALGIFSPIGFLLR